jgi:hypothetical protein
MKTRALAPVLCVVALLAAMLPVAYAQKHRGPRPAKADVPYLMHADNLIELEGGEASQREDKDRTYYTISGASSPARTPLAEPIFLYASEKVSPEKFQLYRMETTRDGTRQIMFNSRRQKDNPKPVRFSITRLDSNLYRLEAQETLEPGEYVLTPTGANDVYCFNVF